MRQATSVGKVVLAVCSLVLAVLIWGKGLQESFSRPSVVPKLSMRQQEISLMANSSIPESLKPFLVGELPENKLRQSLREIPVEQIEERDRLLLATLEPAGETRRSILERPFEDEVLVPIQNALMSNSDEIGGDRKSVV